MLKCSSIFRILLSLLLLFHLDRFNYSLFVISMNLVDMDYHTYRSKFCITTGRSSNQKCSVRKDVYRNFAKFTGKHLCQSLCRSARGLSATSFKKRFWHRRFPVNFAKFLRTPFLQNTSGGCFCIGGSGGFRDCGAWVLKFLITKIILQVAFRQNSNSSKLCSVASDESFVSFLYINDCT